MGIFALLYIVSNGVNNTPYSNTKDNGKNVYIGKLKP